MKIRMNAKPSDTDSFIRGIIKKYHFNEEDYRELFDVYERVRAVITPYAQYRVNSRVTGVRKIDDGTCAVVAMSLGEGIDKLESSLMEKQQLSDGYMLECIASELLLLMYVEFNSNYARFHRRYVERYVFVGDEIPLEELPEILNDIKRDTSGIGVKANEYGVLVPSKSVVFYAVLTDKADTVCEGICFSCNNIYCENRSKSFQEEKSKADYG